MRSPSTSRVRAAPNPFLHKASGQVAVKIRGRFYYLVSGARQIGKTTLLRQAAYSLIKDGIDPENIR